MDLGSLLATFYSLAGVSAVIALLVNTLKVLGVVKDGSAPIWSAGFNLLALVLLFALGVINPGADLVQVGQPPDPCRGAGHPGGGNVVLVVTRGFLPASLMARGDNRIGGNLWR
jgi:hypothetical protein